MLSLISLKSFRAERQISWDATAEAVGDVRRMLPTWYSLLLKTEMSVGLEESLKDRIYGLERSFCCVSPDRQSRASAEAGSCPCSLIGSTLLSAVLAALIAVLPDNSQTRFRGEHVPGTVPSRQFRLKYPAFEGVGKGKKRLWYVELSHAVLPGLRARAWSLVILLTRHFLCVSILHLFKSNSSTSPLCKK